MRVRLSLDGCAHNVGGVGRYAARLTTTLREVGVEARLVAGITANPFLDSGAVALQTEMARTARIGPINRTFERLWDVVAPTKIHHKLWHSPLAPRRAEAVALTVYDMIPELVDPRLQSAEEAAAKRRWCRLADVVFAISETTKAELTTTLGIEPSKVVVTPLGTDVRPVGAAVRKDSTLLYVGGRAGYKDFDCLLVAMSMLPAEVHAVAVGSPFQKDELTRLRELGLIGRVSTFRADDNELGDLYGTCAIHVTTSRAEGFGLPLLEAMASACPVVCADVPALREVGGDAAIYFMPGSGEALREAILYVLSATEATSARVRQGLARAAVFSWRATAEATLKGYVAALG